MMGLLFIVHFIEFLTLVLKKKKGALSRLNHNPVLSLHSTHYELVSICTG